jgi:hypothetical protein
MADFVQTAEAKMQQEAYENNVRFYSDVDSFSQQSQLSLANARAQMKYLHSNNIKGLSLYGPLTISMHAGNTVQFKTFAIRSPDSINVPTLGALEDDVTNIAQWLTSPASTSVVTVVNGLVTGGIAGSVAIYAKLGSFSTVLAVITVS